MTIHRGIIITCSAHSLIRGLLRPGGAEYVLYNFVEDIALRCPSRSVVRSVPLRYCVRARGPRAAVTCTSHRLSQQTHRVSSARVLPFYCFSVVSARPSIFTEILHWKLAWKTTSYYLNTAGFYIHSRYGFGSTYAVPLTARQLLASRFVRLWDLSPYKLPNQS